MKELLFLDTIKSIIGDKYIGNDCAYLNDLGIVVSQDSLVEDIHFKMAYTSPYHLGYKSMMVNISDISASGAIPRYITVSLSLPSNITNDFVKEFYLGAKDALSIYGNIEIVGGDITGSDKIFVSVMAIGIVGKLKLSSRSCALSNRLVVATGVHGSSSAGLELLLNNKSEPKSLTDAHLMPMAQLELAQQISSNIKEDYAMMDTSDGLVDALFKIASASNKVLSVDFDKINYDEKIKEIFPENYEDKILYGGEDYQLVATVPENILSSLNGWHVIGKVCETECFKLRGMNKPCVILNTKNGVKIIDNLEKSYNHFNL